VGLEYKEIYSNILYFENAIPNAKALVQSIENINSLALTPWEPWYANSEGSHQYGDLKSMVKERLVEETNQSTKQDIIVIFNTIATAMGICAIEYAFKYGIDSEQLEYALEAMKLPNTKIGINKYSEGQFMGPHVDWNEQNYDIAYTIVVYLNDDYEGGELYFVNPDIDLKIKPKAGSIVMFPANLPYLHQSCEITKGRKMLITHHWKSKLLLRKDN
jgi:2OG-Fe(II) oxygenase superfamily